MFSDLPDKAPSTVEELKGRIECSNLNPKFVKEALEEQLNEKLVRPAPPGVHAFQLGKYGIIMHLAETVTQPILTLTFPLEFDRPG